MVRYFLIIFTLLFLAFAQEDDVLIKTPLTKRLEEFNVSIGIVMLTVSKTFLRAYSLLESFTMAYQQSMILTILQWLFGKRKVTR